MTYSLVMRDPNSWVQYNDGSRKYEFRGSCGHNHRTLEGAIKCHDRHKKSNSQLGFFGSIEDNKTEDSVDIEQLHRAEDAMWRAGNL